MEQPTEPISQAQAARAGMPTVSRCLSDGTLIELQYDPEARTTAFVVWAAGQWSIEREVTIGGEQLVPFSPRNNLISNEAVLLPSRPQE